MQLNKDDSMKLGLGKDKVSFFGRKRHSKDVEELKASPLAMGDLNVST
jgi:hypothetical protein